MEGKALFLPTMSNKCGSRFLVKDRYSLAHSKLGCLICCVFIPSRFGS